MNPANNTPLALSQYITDFVAPTIDTKTLKTFNTIAKILQPINPLDYAYQLPEQLHEQFRTEFELHNITSSDLTNFITNPAISDFLDEAINKLTPMIIRNLKYRLSKNDIPQPAQLTKILDYLEKQANISTRSFRYIFAYQNPPTTSTQPTTQPTTNPNPNPNPNPSPTQPLITDITPQPKPQPFNPFKTTSSTPNQPTPTFDLSEFEHETGF